MYDAPLDSRGVSSVFGARQQRLQYAPSAIPMIGMSALYQISIDELGGVRSRSFGGSLSFGCITTCMLRNTYCHLTTSLS